MSGQCRLAEPEALPSPPPVWSEAPPNPLPRFDQWREQAELGSTVNALNDDDDEVELGSRENALIGCNHWLSMVDLVVRCQAVPICNTWIGFVGWFGVPVLDILVDCPTRWSLWYWYLDFYVDHLFRYPNDREVQQCAMVLPATNSVDALSKNFSHWPTGIFCQEMISHLKIKLQCASV